ncbi:MAG: hypothetical protein ACJAY8_001385 [Sphingobacteriales bacterium]|jgi:hypothetical protein
MTIHWNIASPSPSSNYFFCLEPNSQFPFVAASVNNQVLFVTRLWRYKKWGETVVANLPFGGYLELDWNLDLSPNQKRAALDEFVLCLIEENKMGRILLHFPPELVGPSPMLNPHLEQISKPTFQIDLSKTEEELWSNVHPKRRNVIRKWMKIDGAEVQARQEFNPNVYCPFIPEKSWTQVRKIEGNDQWLEIEGTLSGKWTAGAVGVHCNGLVKYILGGSEKANAYLGSSVLWALILHSKKQGACLFDFEGSSIPGIYSFFKSFGGQEKVVHGIEYRGAWSRFLKKIRA